MKKFVSIFASVLAVCLMFTACDSKNKVIDVRQAESLIKEVYTYEELGITEEQVKGAKWLRADEVKNINGVEYYEIIITNLVETGKLSDKGEPLYSFQDIGRYYVTIDGKKAFSMNIETGEMTELPKKKVPELTPEQINEKNNEATTNQGATTEHTHEHTHAE